MGRTISSFRLACMIEELKWHSFSSCLNKDDRKIFDEIFSISRQYNSACSNSARPIAIHCILMLIILHNYKQLMDIMKKNPNIVTNRTFSEIG